MPAVSIRSSTMSFFRFRFQRRFPPRKEPGYLEARVLEESSLSSRERGTSGERASWLSMAVMVVVASCVSGTSSLRAVLLREMGWVGGAGWECACWLGEFAGLGEAVHLASCEITGMTTSDGGFSVCLSGVLVVERRDPGEEVVEGCAFWGAGGTGRSAG